jgi:N6-adenosine-specific RNA methylase IME4
MGKFVALMADPPWGYDQKGVQGAAENHYKTMSIDDLCTLPVADLAAKDAVLFLWSTFPMLPDALRVIDAWGFKYKSCGFLWLKKYKNVDKFVLGLGFWTRGNAEVCLLATRGKPIRYDRAISQIVVSPKEEHSRKPGIVREKIAALLGDVPRLELFAREQAPGWDAIGNAIDGQDIRAAMGRLIAEGS